MQFKTLGFAAVALALATAPVSAANTVWTQWEPDSVSPGTTTGSVFGSAGGIGVSYSGDINALQTTNPSWNPNSTWIGGIVTNAPPTNFGAIQLMGGSDTAASTITFETAVTNPVIAIWSLGQVGSGASFDFGVKDNQIKLIAGGTSSEYPGGPLTLSGTTVSGLEGNGTVELLGTFKTISFTTPQFENYYDFTVGIAGAVPEPAAWGMMLIGFFGLGAMIRSVSRKNDLIAGV